MHLSVTTRPIYGHIDIDIIISELNINPDLKAYCRSIAYYVYIVRYFSYNYC